MVAIQKVRRYDLDWLRVLGVLLLIPFHAALVFNLDPRSVVFLKDTVHSQALSDAASFVHVWHMPLLFFIAGASSWFALGSRRPGAYVQERVLRLLVPFVFGMSILIPPMTYIHYIGKPYAPTFWAHYLEFFTSTGNPNSPSGPLTGLDGGVTPAHLWFILFLFVYSLIALPLFTWLRSPVGRKVAADVTGFLALPFAVLLLVIPLTLADWLGILGAQNPIYYLLVFVFGYVLMSSERMQVGIRRQALGMTLFGAGAYVAAVMFRARYYAGLLPNDVLPGAFYNLARWACTLAFLGWGQRIFTHTNSLLRYLSAASYSVYIFHLPVVTVVTYFVIALPASVGIKYLLIVVASTLISFALYEGIKRVPVLCFLMGMKEPATLASAPAFRPAKA